MALRRQRGTRGCGKTAMGLSGEKQLIPLFRGRTVFITGSSRGCGKTSLLAWCAQSQGRDSTGKGPWAFLSSGYDVPAAESGDSRGRAVFRVEAGDFLVTSEDLLKEFPGSAETFLRLPDPTSGVYFVGVRIHRGGSVSLLGPRDPRVLRDMADQLKCRMGVSTLIIDGAAERITQTALVPGASFFHVTGYSPEGRETFKRGLSFLAKCAGLPLYSGGGEKEKVFRVSGVLTSSTEIKKETETVLVEDFTRIFLSAAELDTLLSGTALMVKRAIPLLGVAVNPKGLGAREAAEEIAGLPELSDIPVFLHPRFYEE